MKVINKLPKFTPGQVIDLSYKLNGLPNRLLIKSVFMRREDNCWMYEVCLESIGECTIINESFIVSSMTKKSLPVYKCAEIIRLYNDGWRYCGNFSSKEAHAVACKLATNEYIKNVITRHGLNYNGTIEKGTRGVWIKYYNTINNDGTIINAMDEDKDTIVIK